jgi:hypothetical protein
VKKSLHINFSRIVYIILAWQSRLNESAKRFFLPEENPVCLCHLLVSFKYIEYEVLVVSNPFNLLKILPLKIIWDEKIFSLTSIQSCFTKIKLQFHSFFKQSQEFVFINSNISFFQLQEACRLYIDYQNHRFKQNSKLWHLTRT